MRAVTADLGHKDQWLNGIVIYESTDFMKLTYNAMQCNTVSIK